LKKHGLVLGVGRYQEASGAACNESPLGAAFSIQNWLLSSWNFGAPEQARGHLFTHVALEFAPFFVLGNYVRLHLTHRCFEEGTHSGAALPSLLWVWGGDALMCSLAIAPSVV
jgi:hypothetical protein